MKSKKQFKYSFPFFLSASFYEGLSFSSGLCTSVEQNSPAGSNIFWVSLMSSDMAENSRRGIFCSNELTKN